MKKRILTSLLFVLVLVAFLGCGGGKQAQPAPLSVSVSPSTTSVTAGQTRQFTATVTGSSNTGVTWSLSCAGSACGTINADGLYTAPAMIPASATVTVVATSAADSSKSGSASLAQVPLAVTVSPATAKLNASETTQLAATVTGHSNTAVTWSITSTGCSGTACGTISPAGLYTAPAVVNDSMTVSVTAQSVADPSKSGSAAITLLYAANLKLKGSFAFNYMGYDAAQKELYAIGSFTADGEGNLSGWMDANGRTSGTLHAQQALTGTYHMNASDNRGRMILTVPSGAMPIRFALRAAGDGGRMMLYGVAGAYGLGEFKKQTAADFVLSQTAGNYAMGMIGTSSGDRTAIIGAFYSDGAGAISQGAVDTNESGGPSGSLSFTGSLALASTSGATPGRGTMTVTGGGATLNFSMAMVNNGELFMLSSDPVTLDVPLLSGRMLKQSGGPFSTASLNGTTVFYLGGTIPNSGAAAVIGQTKWTNGIGYEELAMNNGGAIAVNGHPDPNGGIDQTELNVTSTVQSNGRGVWQRYWVGGGSSWWEMFYLVSPNKGFVMGYPETGTTPSAVLFGFFETQSAGPFTEASVYGDYVEATMIAPRYDVPYNVGMSNWTNAAMTGIFDWSNSHDGSGENLSATGSYTMFAPATGAVDATSVSSAGTIPFAMYIIAPDKFVYIPVSRNATNPSVQVVER
jgi:hypothetical protein